MIMRCMHLCARCGAVIVQHNPPDGKPCQIHNKSMLCMVCVKKRK